MARVEKLNDDNLLTPDNFSFTAFLAHIDWSEPWLIGLVLFHLFTLCFTLLTRHHGNVQAGLFLTLLLLVYFSEGLNELAARNWRYFAYQQYFDSQGMFISVVFSAPLLLNCLIMVGQWMWTSGTLMIRLKQAQLRREIRRQRSSTESKKNN